MPLPSPQAEKQGPGREGPSLGLTLEPIWHKARPFFHLGCKSVESEDLR